jgi:hypothetical protein
MGTGKMRFLNHGIQNGPRGFKKDLGWLFECVVFSWNFPRDMADEL